MRKRPKYARYCIHPFMCSELCLGGSELLVFAVIYSFSKEGGIYYGAQEFISRSCGLSVSTVGRAIRSLVEKRYIEKIKGDYCDGYQSIVPGILTVDESYEPMPLNTAELKLPSMKYMNEKRVHMTQLLPDVERPKYQMHVVGDVLEMTAEQYQRLRQLVDEDRLGRYIDRMENLMLEHGYKPFNPYKTIKKWILEDVAV